MGKNGKTRQVTDFDRQQARGLRAMLVRDGFYPTNDTRGDSFYDYGEQNIRQNLLPPALAALDRNDIECVWRVVEALSAEPVDPEFFERETRRQRRHLDFLVRSGQLKAKALVIFDEIHPAASKAAAR